ncbi:MFS transporter [Sphaerisporangium corydalis]|uniref:MFS transporter n=1 Tax=Sphaerisporangium corydalis TaxID=1441875 RepID=A0ABV9EGV9_9ACTN|nr:MFS transporter [Sphaerisporangium corydalis]
MTSPRADDTSRAHTPHADDPPRDAGVPRTDGTPPAGAASHAEPPAGGHTLSPRSAMRRYGLVGFLTWFPPGLMMASMVLLMTSRGLDLGEVGAATAVFSVVVVVLELPTGGLADVVGRRAVLAASALFSVVALSLMAVATSFWAFVLVSVLKGVARALSSGPAQAWYVDTLHAARGRDADLKPGLARGNAMESSALALGTLGGGLMPLFVPGGLVAPMVAAAVAAAALFVVVLVAMPEPPRPRTSLGPVLRGVPVTVGSGIRLAVADPGLRRLLFVASALGAGLMAIELLTPGRLAALTGGAESGSSVYALVASAGFAASALGSWAAPWVARRLRRPGVAAIAGMVGGAVALATLAASVTLSGIPGIVAAGAAYVGMFASVGVAELMRVEMMHRRVGASRRATLMSVDSLQLQFGGVLGSLGLGFLAARSGTASSWWVAAVIVLLAALLYVRLPAVRPDPE